MRYICSHRNIHMLLGLKGRLQKWVKVVQKLQNARFGKIAKNGPFRFFEISIILSSFYSLNIFNETFSNSYQIFSVRHLKAKNDNISATKKALNSTHIVKKLSKRIRWFFKSNRYAQDWLFTTNEISKRAGLLRHTHLKNFTFRQ